MDDLIIFSVFEITQHLKQVIETQIEPLYVRGEISNYTHHSSGHIYFNLKDANATLRCTFFRHANLHLDFRPEEGMEVVCFGKLTVYEKGGSYNLNVQSMSLAGKGDLARQFELLKKKLQEEGLFAAEHKKDLPRYPQRIGIVTSPTGAALQDIKNVLTRRFPVKALVYPAQVQGREAPAQMIAGIRYFNHTAEVEVVILTRGGGSQEDLFCFNDESLAREIFASKIPVISAVGHEIDFTISDFVADLRAPTPSAAAELVVPDKKDLLAYLASLSRGMQLNLASRADRTRKRISELQYNLSQYHPEKLWQNLQLRLDMASMDLYRFSSKLQSALHQSELRHTIALNSMQNLLYQNIQTRKQHLKELRVELTSGAVARFKDISNHVGRLQLQINNLSPYTILKQGYSMVMRDETIISSIQDISPQEELQIHMKDGSAEVQVQQVKPKAGKNAQD
jgi:exodeoxyribonuclease VII large subunit